MLDLAKYIINSKSGKFNPRTFDNRYESALAELVKAKIAGREFKPPKETKVVNLMDALRESAKASGKSETPAAAKTKPQKHKKSKPAPAARRKAS
jgi:DNA end-binding protein Ku